MPDSNGTGPAQRGRAIGREMRPCGITDEDFPGTGAALP